MNHSFLTCGGPGAGRRTSVARRGVVRQHHGPCTFWLLPWREEVRGLQRAPLWREFDHLMKVVIARSDSGFTLYYYGHQLVSHTVIIFSVANCPDTQVKG